ncbi:MAG: PKD domain-containing protein [Clostridium sp.]|nr:PKD domain-containing protein [Clostridium sp.]
MFLVPFLFSAIVSSVSADAAQVQAADSVTVRPDHVNNALTPCFPPVFSQDGGSCGSASRIGYMFTHEINAFRGANSSQLSNIYPTHFTWLLTNSHSGKEGMAMANGIPDATVYGGTTYSRLFGNQDCAHEDFGWMQGYDKWYSAMFNRIERNSFSPYGLDTEQGREYVKNWIWNHNGDNDFCVGGICGIGVASACKPAPIGDDPEGRNAAVGVVGQKYVTRWGDGVDHALTIVGYDDRIVFDLDSNNVYGERDKDECGAWIIVNSWGNKWANEGFIYCPYKYSFPVRQNENGAWKPEFYHVRKNYRPLRTLRLRMDYLRRSELKLLVGVSANLNATEPEMTVEMEHFKFAGDGRSDSNKHGIEARTPMLGKWADGRMHDEPMEFGYDLTDLSAAFDTRRPLKYFFIIETRPMAFSSGRLYDCSVIDYEFDTLGVETPFAMSHPTPICSGGHRTVVTAVVGGEPFFAPVNLRRTDGNVLTWDKPQPTHYVPAGYVVCRNGIACDTLRADECAFRCDSVAATYTVAALYTGLHDAPDSSVLSAQSSPVRMEAHAMNGGLKAMSFHGSGFTIPDVFRTRYESATVEYWLKPHTWYSWNQSAGPGWGRFLIHGNDNGSLSAGWDGGNRIDTKAGVVTVHDWHHFAFVVNKDTLTAYVNGTPVDTLVSNAPKGLGGFGNWPFGTDEKGSIDGVMAELRVWSEARSQDQIRQMMKCRFEDGGMPATLLAYYKGATVMLNDSVEAWYDFAGGHHASFASFGSHEEVPCELAFHSPIEENIDFCLPTDTLYAGEDFRLEALTSPAVTRVWWDAPEAGVNGLALRTASFRYLYPGNYTVRLTAGTVSGRELSVTKEVTVRKMPTDAAFRMSHSSARVGERISFLPFRSLSCARYEWTFPGSEVEKAYTRNAAATYAKPGTYKVRLCLTDSVGRRLARTTRRLLVHNVVPEVHFEQSTRVVLRGQKVKLTDCSRYLPDRWQWQISSRSHSMHAEGKEIMLRMEAPGVYDVSLTASNDAGGATETKRQTLVVCNADSKNGLLFRNPRSAVITDTCLWQGSTDRMTVEWWMFAGPNNRPSAGIGHSVSTWQMTATPRGELVFHVDSASVSSGKGFIRAGEFHHYAVSFHRGEVTFLRDGESVATAVVKNKERTVEQIPAFAFLRLGGETFPMNGMIDELRVWRKALNPTQLRARCNAPLVDVPEAERTDSLVLYYSFNQNSGNVTDLTSAARTGRRMEFGPDGDAWGSSAGVFCLDIP